MVTFCELNSLPQCCWTVQIVNIPYTNVFGDGAIVLAEALKDCSGCAVQLCRFIASHINVVDKQLAGAEVHYAGKHFSQR
jgi:hypothetical protein